MEIQFKNIIPTPLLNEEFSTNSVYRNDFLIDTEKKYLLLSNSGKGKSTFISILYGIRKDYEGDIFFNEKAITTLDINEWTELRKNKLSIVFQDLKLFENQSIIDNLQIKNQLTNHKTIHEIEQMLDYLNILPLKNRMLNTLSLGQQQRVAIIRALLQPFQLLLLDEPFSHLDTTNTKIALGLIEKECNINKAGYIITSLGESHEINDFIKLAHEKVNKK